MPELEGSESSRQEGSESLQVELYRKNHQNQMTDGIVESHEEGDKEQKVWSNGRAHKKGK
jgi:hypothetical protein